ncbi:MAG TPA: LacI family DNA-binding transcriptional regulator [Symbiobacteriaceae bacterium]|nr:LacI family DNA-binding transcriptional regulator [Symbiobacteriaceae bacterium]
MSKPTLLHVAKLAGVSKATASRVLNGTDSGVRISDQTRERVRAAAQKLDYRPNAAARALGSRRSGHIAVVLPAAPEPCHGYHRFSHLKLSEMLSGIHDTIREHQFHLMLQIAGADFLKDEYVLGLWKSGDVDGILWVNLPLHPVLAELACPVVAINAMDPKIPVGYVVTDQYGGSREAVEHLIARGHRLIAHVQGPEGFYLTSERRRAYLDVMKEHGLEPVIEQGDAFEQSGAEALARLLEMDPRPSALFCGGDLMAVGVLKEARNRGLRVPGDLAVVGADGTEQGFYTDPALSTVKMIVSEVAKQATEHLVEAILNPDLPPPRAVLPTEFHPRDSS